LTLFTADKSFLDSHSQEEKNAVNDKERFHRVPMSKSDEIKDGEMREKYRRIDNDSSIPFDETTKKEESSSSESRTHTSTTTSKATTTPTPRSTTTAEPVTTQKPTTTDAPSTTTPKTTTSHVPIDPVTPKTSTKAPETSTKSNNSPVPEENNHFLRWCFGNFIFIIFVCFCHSNKKKLLLKMYTIFYNLQVSCSS
jgi:hypothetical protein